MTIRTAAKCLVVSVLRLLAAIIELVGALFTLMTSLLTRVSTRLAVKAAPMEVPVTPKVPALRVVRNETPSTGTGEVASDKMSRLIVGLVGLGYKTPAVKRFVDGLSPEHIEATALPELIRDGLRALAA